MAALLLLLMSNNIVAGQKPWEHGRLEVSANQHFLQHADGTPFFWLGETAWLMPERLNREEVSYYLDKARDAGYNMAQVQVLNDVPSTNVYGQASHDQQGNLLTDDGYWDHMDHIVSQAELRGIYIGMVCIWGGVVKAGKLSVEQAKTYSPHKTGADVEDGVLVAMDASKDYLSAMVADNLPRLAEGVIDTTRHETLGLKKSEAVRTVRIFTATDHTDHYANGVVMTAFKGKLYCMWQSSPKDEDSDDTWVAYSVSNDEGMTWTAPKPLSVPSDGFYCTSGGWLVRGDTLTAFIDTWQKGLEPRGGRTCYMTTTDGRTWSQLQPVRMADGRPMDGVLEQDPYPLPDGRIVGASHLMPGLHICPVFTDDPTGHNGWKRGDMESEDAGKQSREIEPSQYVQPDGTIVMLFRDQKSSFRKLASVSRDRGETWSKPQITNIPDARTKQCAGNLPDGTSYMVCCPANGKWRWPLVLLLSQDGVWFDHATLLRSGESIDLPPRRYEGRYKTLGFSYPKAFVHNNSLYVSYSVNKEDVECTIIPLKNRGELTKLQ